LGEPVIDALLDQQSVRADAGLSSVAVLRRHRALHRRVEIGVVENDERRVAAEFEPEFLDRRRALRHSISVDPVKVSPRTIGFDVISAPISRAEPVRTENTPAGIPARSASSASARAESGVSAAGLQTKAQPAASAGPALRVIIAFGKFQGVIAATTPSGCLITTMRDVCQGEGIVSP